MGGMKDMIDMQERPHGGKGSRQGGTGFGPHIDKGSNQPAVHRRAQPGIEIATDNEWIAVAPSPQPIGTQQTIQLPPPLPARQPEMGVDQVTGSRLRRPLPARWHRAFPCAPGRLPHTARF